MKIVSKELVNVENAKKELSKIFVLHTEGIQNINLPTNSYIDEVWHNMLKDKEAYEKFSLDACGKVVNHLAQPGEGKLEWIESYENKYGKLNDLWFYDVNGELKEEELEHYHKNGEVVCSWDCKPY